MAALKSMSTLKNELFDEILQARQRVYAVGTPTPLQELCLPGVKATIYAKREDLGPIKAYKWRGAYNCMAKLTPEQRARGVVAASAGNHGQGVALAARRLQCKAHIFMPRSTPEVKQNAVRMHGGEAVEIVLTGDSYDAASHAAHEFAEANGLTFVHPYDHLYTMGGQGTLADEVVMSGKGPFDRVYLQIGGGGLAAACACWFKRFWPECKCIGVEGVSQASMKLAVESGERKTLPYVDVFCDGTAVRTAGELTYELCKELLDDYVTVTNEEVCKAIRSLWNSIRVITEPSGSMGMAALMQDWQKGNIKEGEKCLVVLSGANMDFAQMGVVASRAGVQETNRRERFLQIPMQTKRGQILKYLESIPHGVQLTDVQYGRLAADIQYPVFGVLASDEQFAEIDRVLAEKGLKAKDVTNHDDVRFRMISYDRGRLRHPVFFVIEFPERPGAFTEFMRVIGEYAHLCYFNYRYSGEQVGRALVGMEFDTKEDRDMCREKAKQLLGTTIQGLHELPDDVRHRVLDIVSPAN
ncbi:MAG: pyridoxal-phosphate dependent enzyme [Akkermansia sp.]|nr:pyridoxal-phosphate dependent enzyme [Akkermansia sp.]